LIYNINSVIRDSKLPVTTEKQRRTQFWATKHQTTSKTLKLMHTAKPTEYGVM